MDLIILAAGKGSRMKSDIPKALHIIDEKGTNNIQNTININKGLYSNIYVVVNVKDKKLFENSVKDADIIPIDSGLGSGHAVYETIRKYDISEEFVLVWGDAVFVDDRLSKELIGYPSEDGNSVIPVYRTENPYISFNVTDELKATSVDFSKYGETNESGFQDKCLFKLNKSTLFPSLELIHKATFKNGRYITESKEFEFLYFIHSMYALGKTSQCYLTEYEDSIYSYNSQKELEDIRDILKV